MRNTQNKRGDRKVTLLLVPFLGIIPTVLFLTYAVFAQEEEFVDGLAHKTLYEIQHHKTYEGQEEGVLITTTPLTEGHVSLWSAIPDLVELPDGTVFRTPEHGKKLSRETITIVHFCDKRE